MGSRPVAAALPVLLAIPLAAFGALAAPGAPITPAASAPGTAFGALEAQAPLRGSNVAVAYEGFRENPDGSFDLLFGYYNRNWQEQLDVPIGPDNNIEPGGPDRGQPTHFFPRRNQFVFGVRVPPDFGDDEVVWTLTTNGVTERAYATLRPEYRVDEIVVGANFGAGGQTGFNPGMVGNEAPELTLTTESSVRTRVGETVRLSAVATDDGKPGRRAMAQRLTGQSHFVPNSATGLRLSFFHYRGPGPVSFEPRQTKVWQDRRDGANSPWAAGWETPPVPSNDEWIAHAEFSEPGTYVIRALAHDGALPAYQDITVVVEP